MRVLFVNLAAEWGGGEGWTLRTALGLAARGHDVQIAARSASPLDQRARQAGIEVHSVKVGIDYSPRTITTFFRLLRRHNIEVVVGHHNKDIRTAGVAARMVGCPLVHRNGFPILKDTWRHRMTSRYITRILTNSGKIRDTYRRYHWLTKPIDLVYNGTLPANDKEPDDALRALVPDWPDTSLLGLYSGRLTGVKRVDLLLRGFAALPKSSRWRLVIMGEGNKRDELTHFAETLGLGSRVHFAGFRDDAASMASGADLVMLASREEGMPNALMEAMVRGVPVASTPAGDVEELLGEGKAGWLIPFDDAASWTALLQRLEQQPDEMDRMGQLGQTRIQAKFSFETMIDGVEASLRKALGQTPRPSALPVED
ncbi:glycosyltransferase [bacterium]|nr:glycosyltransferase [bacterium]